MPTRLRQTPSFPVVGPGAAKRGLPAPLLVLLVLQFACGTADTPGDSGPENNDGGTDAASADSSADSGTADGAERPSCADQYGAARGFELCQEQGDRCVFEVHTAGTCTDLCARHGGACITGFDNPHFGEASCMPEEEDGCDRSRTDEICVCTRSAEPTVDAGASDAGVADSGGVVARNASPYSFCQDGNPIGGGADYGGIITSADPRITHRVQASGMGSSTVLTYSNLSALKAFIEARTSGDVVFLDPTLTIDVQNLFRETGEPSIYIHAGVTLASNRGEGASEGVLIRNYRYSESGNGAAHPLRDAWPAFIVYGDNVRVTGIKLDGGSYVPGVYGSPIDSSFGISVVDKNNFELDNCEIMGFRFGAVSYGYPFFLNSSVSDGGCPRCPTTAFGTDTRGHRYHHNYSHHNNNTSLGYSVNLGATEIQIYANRFYYDRHNIASYRGDDTIYEAYCNTVEVDENGHGDTHHNFDVHGDLEGGGGTGGNAGDDIWIHHNDFEDRGIHVRDGGHNATSSWGNIFINGIPVTRALIEYNRFALPDPSASSVTSPIASAQRSRPCSTCGSGLLRPTVNYIVENNTYNGETPAGE